MGPGPPFPMLRRSYGMAHSADLATPSTYTGPTLAPVLALDGPHELRSVQYVEQNLYILRVRSYVVKRVFIAVVVGVEMQAIDRRRLVTTGSSLSLAMRFLRLWKSVWVS